MNKKPLVLMILDGYGIAEKNNHNAISLANTPVMDELEKTCPFVYGYASGSSVGLPDGQMGNSEVGHLNIGAGRIIYQELTRITKAIEDGDFFENEALLNAVNNCKKNDSALHVMGLLSDGGVHSHNKHLYAVLKLAKDNGLSKVYVHAFLDGRDTAPDSGLGYIKELEEEIKKIGVGRIATVMGRYYSMDRDNRWDRVRKAYEAIALGIGAKSHDPVEAVEKSYLGKITDEFVEPVVITGAGEPSVKVNDNDSICFINFRPDRAREITRAFCDNNFTAFERGERKNVLFVCMTDYDKTIENKQVAFKKEKIVNTFGEYLSKLGMHQLRVAETEKYAHVTFFFNGGVEEPFPNEERILVPSPKVATYDLQPEMSAEKVCDNVVDHINALDEDVIIVNFANPDMVGHTGDPKAVIKAIEEVDKCVGRVIEAVKNNNGVAFICADHGNAEMMSDSVTGDTVTAHTVNPVPFILVNYDDSYTLDEKGGRLCDIVPTLLDILGLEKPEEMTGVSLLKKK